MNEIRERLLPVDEQDGDPLAVALLEVRVAGDVDLVELEGDVFTDAREHAARVLAKMAAGRAVERDVVPRGRAHA